MALANLLVISGAIGNGKTLYAISTVEDARQAENCDVFYANIKDVTLPWKQLSMVPSGYTAKEITEKRYPALVPDWRDVPAGSILVIDEAWEFFPKRPPGHKAPEYVEQLAVVRHKGIRLVLITQNAESQIDTFVRALVNEHHFLERKFGAMVSRLYKWGKVEDQNSTAAKAQAQSSLWKFRREFFGTYKSAEVHTVKTQWPVKKFVTLGLALCVVVTGLWFGIHHLRSSVGGKEAQTPPPSPGQVYPAQPSPLALSAAFWVANRRERVAGVPASAPVFDPLQKVRSQPRPEGCMQLVVNHAVRCSCTGPHGAVLEMHAEECTRLVKGGWFDETQAYSDVKAQNIAHLNAASQAAVSSQASDGNQAQAKGAGGG